MRPFLPAGPILAAVVLSFSPAAFPQPLFAPPVNLGPKINTASHEWDPFLTADGKKLFFVRSFDIWYAEWNGTDWNSPIRLGPQINTGPGFEKSPSITPDRQKLYFVTYAGMGWDIWVSTFDSSINDWGIPVNLGPPVNTAGAEFSAHLSPDGQRLYFTSEGARECGIYMSEWNGSAWSVPQLQWGCGTPEYPSVTADSQWLFFEQYVGDGTTKNIFVSVRTGSEWGFPPINLKPQIGDSSWTPFIVPSGDSLFFNSNRAVCGFGGGDIWMAQRLLRGDLNIDGQRTAADVVLEINKVFLGQFYPAPEPVGDMNCDTRFSPADLGILLLVVFAGMPPECAAEETNLLYLS